MASRRPCSRVACKLVVRDLPKDWPDPGMVPSVALRRCETAQTLEEVRAIVRTFLPAKE